ncbi:MAG: hypothetical protein IJZ61_06490 [Oscillospiraceae bacterium]|nr:hypothetical protein [Oscillospiraceae bacterium]
MLDDIIELIIELAADIFFDTYDFETGSKRFRIGWVVFLSVVMLAAFACCLYFFVTTNDDMKWLYGAGAVIIAVMEICLLYKYFKTK